MSVSSFVPSNQWRHLRACLVCSVVQTFQRFVQFGCPNCEDFLDLINHAETVNDCTSKVFEGLITLSDPKRSWVAKWQRLDNYTEGVYATKVVGILPDEVLQDLEDRGIKYIPRDGTGDEDEA